MEDHDARTAILGSGRAGAGGSMIDDKDCIWKIGLAWSWTCFRAGKGQPCPGIFASRFAGSKISTSHSGRKQHPQSDHATPHRSLAIPATRQRPRRPHARRKSHIHSPRPPRRPPRAPCARALSKSKPSRQAADPFWTTVSPQRLGLDSGLQKRNSARRFWTPVSRFWLCVTVSDFLVVDRVGLAVSRYVVLWRQVR